MKCILSSTASGTLPGFPRRRILWALAPTGPRKSRNRERSDRVLARIDKFLAEQKTLEAHRHELIKEVLRQKKAAIKAFDEKLAKLG